MTVQKKLADTLRDSMNKIRNQQTENAKSSLCILRKTRQDFENSENYNPMTESPESKQMYNFQILIFESILIYDWNIFSSSSQSFLDLASKIMPSLDHNCQQKLERTAQQMISQHSSDQMKLVMGVAQIQIEDEYFHFKSGIFEQCEKITNEELDGKEIEIVQSE